MISKNILDKIGKQLDSNVMLSPISEIIEEWKPIYLGGELSNYVISSHGYIKNIITRKFIKASKNENGYLKVGLYYNKKSYTRKIHRLVAQAFIPNPRNKRTVNHKDGDKTNNKVWNLEWNTHLENIRHAMKTGLMINWAKGEDSGSNVYSEKTVHEVCKLLSEGKGPKEISRILGVPRNLPSCIKYRDKWKHISSLYKIPKVGELPKPKRCSYEVTPENEKLVHQICKLILESKGDLDISKSLNVSGRLISNVRLKKEWTSISKNYNLPEPKYQARPDDRANVLALFDIGVLEPKDVIEKLGWSDTRANRKYVSLIKFQSKESRSTTI